MSKLILVGYDPRRADYAPAGKPAEIGVGYVVTEEGRHALRSAHAFARHIGAALRVVTVVLGSVTRRVIAAAHSPVIVCLGGVKASLEALLETAPGAAAPA
jgi:hypothetical protein